MIRFSKAGKSVKPAAIREIVVLRPIIRKSRRRPATEESVNTARNSLRRGIGDGEFVRPRDKERGDDLDRRKICCDMSD